MSFRKEKKYKLNVYEYHSIKSMLHKKGLKKMYEERIINSLYFDSSNLQMFEHSEEGVLPRKKIRIRWYNNDNKLFIEKKISSLEGRYKLVHNLIDSNFFEVKKDYSLIDKVYGVIKPSLLVTYSRDYYLLKNVRITFDKNISYTNFRKNINSTYNDPENVMEIKVDFLQSDDFIESLVPYPTFRFSKYSRGILFTN